MRFATVVLLLAFGGCGVMGRPQLGNLLGGITGTVPGPIPNILDNILSSTNGTPSDLLETIKTEVLGDLLDRLKKLIGSIDLSDPSKLGENVEELLQITDVLTSLIDWLVKLLGQDTLTGVLPTSRIVLLHKSDKPVGLMHAIDIMKTLQELQEKLMALVGPLKPASSVGSIQRLTTAKEAVESRHIVFVIDSLAQLPELIEKLKTIIDLLTAIGPLETIDINSLLGDTVTPLRALIPTIDIVDPGRVFLVIESLKDLPELVDKLNVLLDLLTPATPIKPDTDTSGSLRKLITGTDVFKPRQVDFLIMELKDLDNIINKLKADANTEVPPENPAVDETAPVKPRKTMLDITKV